LLKSFITHVTYQQQHVHLPNLGEIPTSYDAFIVDRMQQLQLLKQILLAFVNTQRASGTVSQLTSWTRNWKIKKSSASNLTSNQTPHPPTPWQAFKMALVVPSFNTPLHTRYSPPPPLAKESSSVGRALAPHRLAPRWLHT